MNPVTDRSFGILIAYLLPGFLVIWAIGDESTRVSQWLAFDRQSAPTVGGFLYVTLASIGIGLMLSTLRWVIIDQIHHHTGIHPPDWKSVKLQQNIDAYRTAVDFHYRYYQFYGNTIIAVVFLIVADVLVYDTLTMAPEVILGAVCLTTLFFAASRDALAKYYRHTASFTYFPLRPIRSIKMTNGGAPNEASTTFITKVRKGESIQTNANTSEAKTVESMRRPKTTKIIKHPDIHAR